MKRYLLSILAALSLLLCVAAVVVWVRSHFVRDMLDYRKHWMVPVGEHRVEFHQRQTVINASLGSLLFTTQHSINGIGTPPPTLGLKPRELYLHHTPPAPVQTAPGVTYAWNRMGFRYGTMDVAWPGGRSIRLAGGAVPLWFVAAVFALLPTAWTIVKVRGPRTRSGFEVVDEKRARERCRALEKLPADTRPMTT